MASFSLLTFNIFGVSALLNRRRLLTAAHAINGRPEQVACLQEVQTHGVHHLLRLRCDSFPHQAFEPHLYAPRGGLLTLARLPVIRRSFAVFREQGRAYNPQRPLRKGVLATSFAVGGREVVVLNTHLFANFSGDWRPTSRGAQVELAQARQLVEVVEAQPPDALVIICGDMNFPRGCFVYDALVGSGLVDPLAGDPRPTWRPPPLRALQQRLVLALDHVLLRDPGWPGLRAEADLILDELQPFIGGGRGYLSDHVGLALRVSWGEEAGP